MDESESSETCKQVRARASRSSAALIGQPRDADVVLGRGSAQASRPGNVNFHSVLDQKAQHYHATTTTKKMKGKIVQQIYQRITDFGGRFFAPLGDTGQFIEADEEDAKVKISDGIRYRRKRKRTKTPREVTTEDSAAQKLPSEERDEMRSEEGKEATKAIEAQTSVAAPHPPVSNSHEVRNTNLNETIEIFSDEDLSSVLGEAHEYR